MENTLLNKPPTPEDIPPEYGYNLGRGLCAMYQRLISTPEGRAKLEARKAAHQRKEKHP